MMTAVGFGVCLLCGFLSLLLDRGQRERKIFLEPLWTPTDVYNVHNSFRKNAHEEEIYNPVPSIAQL